MNNENTVMMAHGSGGLMMKRLIDSVFFEAYASDSLKTGDDAATLNIKHLASKKNINGNHQISYSTDSFVVTPHFFAGGDIGKLAVCGTVNDVSTSGAVPVALSVSMILEEGFLISDLKKICHSIKVTADEAGVEIVTGDTKVVNKGKCDGIFINTSGIGVLPQDVSLSAQNIKPDQVVILSGTLGDHGIAIMQERKSLSFSSKVKSDVAPLNQLAQDVMKSAPHTVCFRDPTRGGLASTLNEFAESSGVTIEIDETQVPVKQEVKGACEMLGFDVFQVANEGKFVIIVPEDEASKALRACKNNIYGRDASIIGRTIKTENSQAGPRVLVKTSIGSTRVLDMLVGDLLPRIC